MAERSKFIKVRVTEPEYRELRKRADEHGVTISEHVRCAVTAVHQETDVAAELEGIRLQLQELARASIGRTEPRDRVQHEALLLLRELAAARDAQILNRVRAQLAAQRVESPQRGGAA